MKVRSCPSAPHQATRSSISFSLTPAQRHGVDLDLEPSGAGRVDSGHHLVEPAPAGDLDEFLGVAGVEGDVHPAHARRIEPFRMARQLAAVGGERQLVECAAPQVAAQALEQLDDALPHQRLAAGDAELAHAQAHERAAQPIELLQRQQLRLGQEAHVLRHAIDTAEVTPVGDRHPQIGDVALEWVDQHGFPLHGRAAAPAPHAVLHTTRGRQISPGEFGHDPGGVNRPARAEGATAVRIGAATRHRGGEEWRIRWFR